MTRRGYVAGALGVLVLVLVALTVVPRVLDGDGDVAVEPLSADDFYRVDGELTCDTDVKEVPVLPLEAEPVALLVCANPESSLPWTAPTDLVEGDLSDLVDRLANLEATPDEPYDCTMQAGPSYDLVLRFSRGRVAKVHGDTGGCGTVGVASGEWFGAQDVLDTALALVEQQRDGRTPAAASTTGLTCDGVLGGQQPALSLTGDAADLVTMVSCWQPNARKVGSWRQAVVPPRDVRILTSDLAASASTRLDPMDLRCVGGLERHYLQHLVGRTAWGDLLMVPGECRRFIVGMLTDDPPPIWHPSPRAQRVLDRLRR